MPFDKQGFNRIDVFLSLSFLSSFAVLQQFQRQICWIVINMQINDWSLDFLYSIFDTNDDVKHQCQLKIEI